MNRMLSSLVNKYLLQMKKLLNTGFFHIFSSSVINKVMAFLSNIIIVRLVSKGDFGVYSYALNILSLILLVSGMGLVSGTFQLCSEKEDGSKESIYKYGYSRGIIVNIILCAVVIMISQLFEFKIENSNEILFLMFLNPVLLIVFDFQQIYLRSHYQNKEYSYATTINTFVVVLLSILGAGIYGVEGIIFGRYIAYIITIIIVSYFFKVPLRVYTNVDIKEKISLYKISVISMLNNGISELLYLLDIFLLGIILSNESIIASYKVATVIPTACTFIPMAVITYVYPYFAAHKDDRAWCLYKYKQLIVGMGILNLIISLLLIVLAEPIIILLYGKAYIDAVPCFILLVINYFFSGTFKIISGNLLVAQRKLGFNLFTCVICGIVNIVGNILLIPKFESMGAAITTFVVVFISSVLSTTYYVYILKKES